MGSILGDPVGPGQQPTAAWQKSPRVQKAITLDPERLQRRLQERASSMEPIGRQDYDKLARHLSVIDSQRGRNLSIVEAQDSSAFRLYDLNQDAQSEQDFYKLWMKERLKLFKAMFKKYAQSSL
jgi:hypothetical protein